MKQDEKSPIPNNSTDLFKYKTAIKEQAKKTNKAKIVIGSFKIKFCFTCFFLLDILIPPALGVIWKFPVHS